MLQRPIRAVLAAAARSQGRTLLRHFQQACRSVEKTQRLVLAEVLAQQADSKRGQSKNLNRIDSTEAFRRALPLTDYEEMRPWVDEMIESGDPGVMFGPGERLLLYAMTSGSESEPKHIPVTTESHARYRRGWSTWVAAALRDHRSCFRGQVLPVVSPSAEQHTKHGIPCGAMSGLSTETQSRFVRQIYAIPAPIYGLSNQADKYYALARWGAAQSVSFLVTANPSSFLMLAQMLERRAEDIIRDIRDGTLAVDISGESEGVHEAVRALRPDSRRAAELETILKRGNSLRPKDIWPHLAIMTNWKGGTLGHYLELYPASFGSTPVRDIGLLASEGRMTIPMSDEGAAGPLDLFSHFYEFIPLGQEDIDQPETLLAHELERGGKYYVVLTNFSGLHRYNICDVVQVEEFMDQCPVVRFLNKGSRFSSITGEKLSEHQVTVAVREVARSVNLSLTDYMVLPVWGNPPCYALIAGASALGDRGEWLRILETLDNRLKHHNIEYECKRDSMRLGHIRLGIVDDNFFNDVRLERIATSGGRSEQYKPTYLCSDIDFVRSLDILDEIAIDDETGTKLLVRS